MPSIRYSVLLPAVLAMAMLLLPARMADAHPHVFAKVRVDVLFDTSGLATGIRQSWTFDEMFTAFALSGLGKTISRETLAPLAQRYGASAKAFGYFTRARLGDRDAALGEPAEFTMDLRDEELVLEFVLPFSEPIKPASGFVLMFFDPSYYVALELAKQDAVQLVGAPPQCSFVATSADKYQAVDESFFQSLADQQDWAARFANTVRIQCAAADAR